MKQNTGNTPEDDQGLLQAGYASKDIDARRKVLTPASVKLCTDLSIALADAADMPAKAFTTELIALEKAVSSPIFDASAMPWNTTWNRCR